MLQQTVLRGDWAAGPLMEHGLSAAPHMHASGMVPPPTAEQPGPGGMKYRALHFEVDTKFEGGGTIKKGMSWQAGHAGRGFMRSACLDRRSCLYS